MSIFVASQYSGFDWLLLGDGTFLYKHYHYYKYSNNSVL